MADETIGTTLRRIYERSGLSYTKIAQDAGMAGRSSVQRYFSEDFDGPLSAAVCEKLVKGFQSSPIAPEEIWALAQLPPPNALAFQMADNMAPRLVRDLPIYGTALAAPLDFNGVAVEQTNMDQGDVISYYSRPAALAGRRDVYGVYIQGASMSPRFQEGEVVFVDPKRPPQIGDDVLVFLRKEEDDAERITACLIKRLVRRTSQHVELEQFNPATTFRIDRASVSQVHRVIPWGELLA